MAVVSPGFPAVTVSISLGATRLQGYGDVDTSCWLSVEDGVIWAFGAPAAAILLVSYNNSIIN